MIYNSNSPVPRKKSVQPVGCTDSLNSSHAGGPGSGRSLASNPAYLTYPHFVASQ